MDKKNDIATFIVIIFLCIIALLWSLVKLHEGQYIMPSDHSTSTSVSSYNLGG